MTEANALAVQQFDEPEVGEPAERPCHVVPHRLGRGAFVESSAVVCERPEERLDAEQPVEAAQDRGAVDDAGALQRCRIEVEQRQRLPDKHLAGRALPARESVARPNEEEVAVGAVDQACAGALATTR